MTAQSIFLLIWLGAGLMCFGFGAALVHHQRRTGARSSVAPQDAAVDGTTVPSTMTSPQQLAS